MRIPKHCAAPDAHAILHHHTRTEAHIGPNAAVLTNTGTWVLRVLRKVRVSHLSPKSERISDRLGKGLTTSTFPTMPGPECSLSGCFCLSDCRKRHMPVRKSLGWPMSIQKPVERRNQVVCLTTDYLPSPYGLAASPCSSMAYSCPSLAITGKISFSMDVGFSCGSGQLVSRPQNRGLLPPVARPAVLSYTPGCAAAQQGSGCTCLR